MTQYTEAECLAALRKAAQVLNKSPTRREYEELGEIPSAAAIREKFDRWNKAKCEAGLEVNRGRPAKPVRTDYFEQIDTVPKAYWLGFLFGDGSMIVRNAETGQLSVQLTLSEKDLDHLQRYKRVTRSENALIEYEDKWTVRIGDQQFAEHLYDKGLTPTKSTDGSLPELSSWELRRGFVRGIADADGYYGECKWTLTDATDRRLKRLQDWIPVDLDIVHDNFDGRSWAYLRTSRGHKLNALYGWLFPRRKDTEPAMPRKKAIALETLRAD